MFWLIIILAAVVAFSMPWTFKYLIMTPFLGFILGGFVWSMVGLLGWFDVWGVGRFSLFILSGMIFVASQIRKHDP